MWGTQCCYIKRDLQKDKPRPFEVWSNILLEKKRKHFQQIPAIETLIAALLCHLLTCQVNQ